MNRRAFLIILVAAAFAELPYPACAGSPELAFAPEGTFRIVQFSDTQDGPDIDPRTPAAMGRIIDAVHPGLVVITGDCVHTGKCQTPEQLKKAIDNIARPMEDRGVAWAVTFGNHDRDNLGKIGVTDEEMLGFYMAYPCNLNTPSPPGIVGAGSANLLVLGASSAEPVFGVWLLDSGAYIGEDMAGRSLDGYDWVRFSQVRWYWDTSVALEKRYGRKIPSLMFFHIPLLEYRDLLNSGRFTGERNEDAGGSRMNGGLFAAALERGDVKGMSVGHQHNNTLIGDWHGIRLGYGGSIGYGAYGLGGDDRQNNRLRGAQVFEISEKSPERFTARYVTAASLEQ